VSLVLVYHLFPERLTGGYVGVDVFFVISGFLITSHLVASPPSGVRDLLGFWARRIRRLLPASLLVLAVTLVASRLLAPASQWENTARQVAAAAEYRVNWLLAHDAVDYLAAENAATPVQHFWSLSVEEQFYLGWPVLILVLSLVALAVRRARRHVLAAGLAVVCLASLAWSIHATGNDPAAAYFVTPTRIWELGAGGLLAVWATGARGLSSSGSPLRSALAWAGLAAITVAAVRYSAATPFPGWLALVPVLGTVVAIGAQSEAGPGSPGTFLATAPVQWLGDVSYSVYLWHWPLIVLAPTVVGSIGITDAVAIAILTLLLAGATKVLVEDPFRTGAWTRRLRTTYLAGAVGMVVVVALSAAQLAEVRHDQHDERARLAQALRTMGPCFGAAALDPGADCPASTADPVPAPTLASRDKSAAYPSVGGHACFSFVPDFPTRTCRFGERGGAPRIALVGNSHAGQWLTALQELAGDRGWEIRTYLASQCAMADLDQLFDTGDQTDACRRWVRRTATVVAEDRPDLVVLTNRISVPASGHTYEESYDAYRAGYSAVLKQWAAAGVDVLVLHDTPTPGNAGLDSVPDCVAQHPDDLASCSAERDAMTPRDPAYDVARTMPGGHVSTVDLADHICGPTRCDPVVGGVLVYFDASHLTATFARTLAPYLAPAVDAALGRRQTS
jgi:peptidoglycan/LPS O-acetylase OafA/YrhL